MSYQQLHSLAEKNWNNCIDIRRRYPTFIFYWHEQYERVYNIPHRNKLLDKVLHVHH
ncbi:MAG: hypothetical protein PVF34_03795 [Gammaproteobacteria bacterium]